MDFVAVIVAVVAFVLGVGVGAWGYRAQLKRNPEKIEALAKAIKEAGVSAGKRFE